MSSPVPPPASGLAPHPVALAIRAQTAQRRPERGRPRWPILAWTAQLVVPAPVLAFGIGRLLYGPPLGVVMWPAVGACGLWLAAVLAFVLASRGRRWLVAVRFKLLFSVATIVLLLAVSGEIGVRLLVARDGDGNIFFREHHLKPYRLPVHTIDAKVTVYLNSESSLEMYDPDLGWVPRANSSNGLYTYNAAGVRVEQSTQAYDVSPPPDVCRICVLGDSFAFGSEVAYPDTWVRRLDRELNRRGAKTQVLNFGVSGYGMDQAYLRWLKSAAKYSPQIVVFGFQLENTNRNVNLIRPLYSPHTGLPFSKPRFVRQGNGLELINHPAVPPERLANILRNPDGWDLLAHEQFYDPTDYETHIWHVSKFLSLVIQVAEDRFGDQDRRPPVTQTMTDVTLEILRSFEQHVTATGSRFVIVQLPLKTELNDLRTKGTTRGTDLLRQVSARFDFVPTAQAMLERADGSSLESLFSEQGHYSALGNRVVAEVLADHLAESVLDASRVDAERLPVNPGVKVRQTGCAQVISAITTSDGLGRCAPGTLLGCNGRERSSLHVRRN